MPAIDPSLTNLAAAFAKAARDVPERLALRCEGGEEWTYAELAGRAGALGRALGIGSEARVAVVGGRSAGTAAAILGALGAGAAYCIVDPTLPVARRQSILDDLAPAAIVLADPLLPAFEVKGAPVLRLADLPLGDPACFDPPPLPASALAYVLFTSGSTGRPKGVLIEHGSVLAMIGALEALAPSGDRTIGAWVAPPAFDVSVWEIFSVLAVGGTLHIPAAERLSGGEELWEGFCRECVESAYVPPGLVAPVAEAAERRRGQLKRLLVGVEPIAQQVLDRLARACPGLRIVNGYGPTEATICATLHLFEEAPDPHRRVPIGRAVAGSRVALLREDLTSAPVGDPGEIVVFGNCLARGYLNAPPGGFVTIGGERAYRTGDVGRLLPDGSLEFVGRTDGQVKISGFRVEIAEIEAALAAMPDVERSVVLVSGASDVKRLVAAVAAPAHVTARAVRAYLETRLPAYAVPARIAVMPALPLSTNGKVDRERLLATSRERLADVPAYVAPRTAWEEEVAEAWSRALEIAEVGIDDPITALGGRSLDAVRIAADLTARGRPVLASAVIAAGTIRNLPEPATVRAPVLPVVPGRYPAGRVQAGLWAWRELHPGSPLATVVHAARLDGPVDAARMVRAWRAVTDRHEALRTTFTFAPEGLMQTIAAEATGDLEIVDVADPAEVDAEILRWLEHRFDVSKHPWSVRILLGAGFGAFVLAADHMVLDGEAAQIAQRDLALAYDDPATIADPVPGPASLDAAVLTPAPERAERLHAYARATLAGFTDRPMLPEPLAPEPSEAGLRRIRGRLDRDLFAALEQTAQRAATTPFVVVLAALKAFLRRRDGQADNTVAIALSLRRTIVGADAVGHFVGLVPIRDRASAAEADGLAFDAYLARTATLFATAMAHGELPFEAMLAEASGDGAAGYAPSARPARVVLVQQASGETTKTRAGLRFAPWPEVPSNAIYDLTLFVTEPDDFRPGAFEWVWPAGATLEPSVADLSRAFMAFLRAAVEAPGTRLGALPALCDEEESLVLATATPSPRSSSADTLVSLFATQVERRPNAVAVQEPTGSVSYDRLARRAAGLAAALGQDAGRGAVVVVLDRSADQLAAMLAALSIGAPYLPLAPEHALTRLPDLAIRSGARRCITHSRHAAALSLPRTCRTILVDAVAPAEADVPLPKARARIGPDDLAYVMPTSGSTGAPKLVGVPHRAVVRLVQHSETIPLDETDVTMLVANPSFDAATLEIWGALVNGGSVVAPGEDVLRDPARLCAAIERHGVTCGFFTTTIFEQMLPHVARLAGMKHVIVGGEAVPPHLLAAAASAIPRNALLNGYGPTENTTFSCCFRLDRDLDGLRSTPIGPPITGSGAIVVDEALRPIAPGMPGEILVTGAGLAVGYIDDAELTRQSFVALPALGGIRAYRTGDLGRLLPDGALEYLGRLDRQLKIRGFRVEPGEVEAVLATHPAVRRCTAYADDLGGVRALVAAVEAADVTEAALRAWVADRLPSFMVPTRVHIVDRFPVTANGKLDAAALRAAPSAPTADAQAPGTEAERAACAIAAELLGVVRVSPDDDLFALGANSMTALALASRLSDQVGTAVSAHWVFESRTVVALARRITTQAATTPNAPPRHIIQRAIRIVRPPPR